MPDREKVLAGLRACSRTSVYMDCREAGCPYVGRVDLDSCTTRLAAAALRLLDAPPRVLTVREIMAGSGGGWYEFYVTPDEEDPGGFELTECGWCRGVFVFDDGSSGVVDRKTYGKLAGCRIWTARPDDDLREKTPWKD